MCVCVSLYVCVCVCVCVRAYVCVTVYVCAYFNHRNGFNMYVHMYVHILARIRPLQRTPLSSTADEPTCTQTHHTQLPVLPAADVVR